MDEEIEVNFRLDAAGRTASTKEENNKFIEDGVDTAKKDFQIRYEPASTMSELRLTEDVKEGKLDQSSPLLDEILYDCEITDCGLMPRTFWVPSEGFEPRCSLEQMALDIFKHHVGQANYDRGTSGAEWWVQIRPSPDKIGRYAMHDKSDDPNDMAKEGISFHWDKDEDLRILCGGSTYVHPHLSTVTYLTDFGAPTMAFNIRVNNMTGEYILPSPKDGDGDGDGDKSDYNFQAFLSWPKFGKHLSFDGRYLHAAPADIMEKGDFQKQIQLPDLKETASIEERKKRRRHRRVTFLVNIWLNYKPFGVKPFPETMIDKLSGHQKEQPKVSIKVSQQDACQSTENSSDSKEYARTRDIEMNGDKGRDRSSHKECLLKRFQWPLGDCDSGETMHADVPIRFVREDASKGGSLRLHWRSSQELDKQRGLRLCFDSSDDGATGIERKAKGGTTNAEGPKRQRLE